ncbi:DASS family sodium-coupled anion symporter [Secundilactobacillus mixtipabuli]|uniref:2-oxoglutarate translocator n=1 Tax=Secundilactobacillus mixtipabuli TaxID=1435342 RepID=A0A1Z5IAQ5_9LACO|nr:DASS family sodium-coupled anion symporter [Secundilactobacillus mixtipabuli]GAW98718.1 2-oxoglutarate translocator [Secundilactobacillus mixtipabuli]
MDENDKVSQDPIISWIATFKHNPKLWVKWLVPIIVGLIIWFIPAPAGIKIQAWHLLAIFIGTVVGIITGPLPMGAVSMLGLVLVLVTGTLTTDVAFTGFSQSTVWMIVAAFFIARSIIKSGLGSRIALFLVSKLGSRVLGASYALALTDLILAPATPAAVARGGGVIMPILRSVSGVYGSEPNSPSSKKAGEFLTITAFQVNVITPAMFLTALSANPLAAQLAGQQGVVITWGKWALAACVPGIVSLLVIPFLLYKLYPPTVSKSPEIAAHAKDELHKMGKITPSEWVTIATVVIVLGLWMIGDPLFGLDSTTVGFIGMAVLILSGALTWNDVKSEKQAWDTFFWMGSLVMMATELSKLGLIPWISKHIVGLIGGMGWIPAFLILCGVYFFSHYLIASNVAQVSAMYAAFLAAAIAVGVPPLFAALILGFISSLDSGITHYSNATAPLMFGMGYVSVAKWWVAGLICAIVNIVIWMSVGSLWMHVIGLW